MDRKPLQPGEKRAGRHLHVGKCSRTFWEVLPPSMGRIRVPLRRDGEAQPGGSGATTCLVFYVGVTGKTHLKKVSATMVLGVSWETDLSGVAAPQPLWTHEVEGAEPGEGEAIAEVSSDLNAGRCSPGPSPHDPTRALNPGMGLGPEGKGAPRRQCFQGPCEPQGRSPPSQA